LPQPATVSTVNRAAYRIENRTTALADLIHASDHKFLRRKSGECPRAAVIQGQFDQAGINAL